MLDSAHRSPSSALWQRLHSAQNRASVTSRSISNRLRAHTHTHTDRGHERNNCGEESAAHYMIQLRHTQRLNRGDDLAAVADYVIYMIYDVQRHTCVCLHTWCTSWCSWLPSGHPAVWWESHSWTWRAQLLPCVSCVGIKQTGQCCATLQAGDVYFYYRYFTLKFKVQEIFLKPKGEYK